MTYEVLRVPESVLRHECELPHCREHTVGTVVRCTTCGRRYTLTDRWAESCWGRWARRYWPWPR